MMAAQNKIRLLAVFRNDLVDIIDSDEPQAAPLDLLNKFTLLSQGQSFYLFPHAILNKRSHSAWPN